jgi:hypothetical protein
MRYEQGTYTDYSERICVVMGEKDNKLFGIILEEGRWTPARWKKETGEIYSRNDWSYSLCCHLSNGCSGETESTFEPMDMLTFIKALAASGFESIKENNIVQNIISINPTGIIIASSLYTIVTYRELVEERYKFMNSKRCATEIRRWV